MKVFESSEKASYDFWGQYIFINSEKKLFEEQLISNNPLNVHDVNTILLHEYRHWIDHVGTLYGQYLLLGIYRGMEYSLYQAPFDIHPFSPLVIEQELNRNNLIKIDKIETLTSNKIEDLWSFYCKDNILGKYPIQTMHFKSPLGYEICSTPILYSSLFETNAVSEELHYYSHFSKEFYKNNKSAKLFEDQMYYRSFAERTYNSNLIVYSSSTHFIASIFELPHVLNSYYVASQICTILLNLTSNHLNMLMSHLMKGNTNHYHVHYVRNRDFGYLLLRVCLEYKKVQKGNTHFDPIEFLNFFGLPKLDVMENDIVEEMRNGIKMIPKTSILFKRFNKLIDLGIDVFQTIGINGKKKEVLTCYFEGKYLDFIPLIYSDEMWDCLSLNDLKSLETINFRENWYCLVNYLYSIAQKNLKIITQ